MARPQRNNVDYFPHYISDGKKMFIIESKFGNDGYAVWFKILETLAKTDDHWIDLQDESNLMFLSAKCRVSDEKLIEIIEAVVKLGELDDELWNQQKVIWCQKFNDSIEDAYRKRSNNCMNKETLISVLKGLGRNIKGFTERKGVKNPQSKVKDSKENEIKEYNNTDSPTESSDNVDALDAPPTDTPKDVCKNNKRPTIDLVIDYFVKNGYSEKAAVAAFEYYEAGTEPGQIYWRDSKGNEVRSWKQKMRGVWFKEENKVADDTAGDLENGWRFVPMSEAYEIVRDLSFTSMHEAELRGEADEYVRKVMNARVQYEVHGNAWKTRK